jgi:hypothetical protein
LGVESTPNGMTETQLEVYRARSELQARHTYFLLTAAGAGIALAVNQTYGSALAWPQVPLGLAISSWALSFFCGHRYVQYVLAILFSNQDLIKVQRGEHPEIGRNPALMEPAAEGIRLAIGDNNEKARSYADWQFRFLIAGGVLYVSWHVLEMYLKRLM